MSMVEYYEIALNSLEESAKVYKEIDSPELYGDALLDLTRYAFLAQKTEKAKDYASEAIDYSLVNAALLLTDSELVSSIATIEAIIQTKIKANLDEGDRCLETLMQLHVPYKKDIAKLEKQASVIKRLRKDISLLSSKKIANLSYEIETFLQEEQFKTIIEHEAQKKARKIKDQLDRKIALEKAEKEKRKREKELAEKVEQKILLVKQEQEVVEQQIRLAEQEQDEIVQRKLLEEREKQVYFSNERIAAERRVIKRRKKIVIGVVVILILTIIVNFL